MKQSDILAYPFFFYSLSRSIIFSFEQKILDDLSFKKKNLEKPTPEQLEQLHQEVLKLLKNDAKNIVDGIYPPQVLNPQENPIKHILRLPFLLKDHLRAKKSRASKKNKEFSKNNKFLDEALPEYFKRNFHFQKEGYLSTDSAKLYDHQVEILFSGTTNAMRRMGIEILKRKGKLSNNKKLKILELASGTGSASLYYRMAFPNAQIILSDLSFPYLKQAQDRLKDFERIDFIHANAEDLPFKDESFDVVVSTFLFHEVPLEARKNIFKEVYRVLRAGGHTAHVDSIQKDDIEAFNVFLENFPKEFHEPFYKNYSETKLEGLLEEGQFQNVSSQIGLLSKAVYGRKPKTDS